MEMYPDFGETLNPNGADYIEVVSNTEPGTNHGIDLETLLTPYQGGENKVQTIAINPLNCPQYIYLVECYHRKLRDKDILNIAKQIEEMPEVLRIRLVDYVFEEK